MVIRSAHAPDEDSIWRILEPVLREGETFAQPRDLGPDAALGYWMHQDHEVFVAEDEGVVVGSYFLRPNQRGGGSHVANAGYMTSPTARGRGVARAMLEHSLAHARARGYRAMQFNFVVSTNERAIAIWLAYGFEIVGRLPQAFEHPHYGLVDALVMFKTL